ncbi:MAG: hypothetical protein BGO38_00575 [Cellulomonas sp. 73-145]|uniref:maleylpyruvate isomerase N-terminal domain-containing protein n=1 Tax=Cellulomonas sp. 73-145 TaxID=1895739 RepID=UPI00092C57C6|nr:maleylpyruvate isomerase N-terminal domain-containing protein [Cellulomonas sp. 73-145]OJV60081.1 MAG: hypothetical protein BGO38_00575 [Cellulomonas sp. 73-145]
MPLPATEIALLTDTLARQWRRVRTWVGDAVGDDVRGEPSVLPGWTVAELVAHLARAMDALAVCVPAEPTTVPATFAEYLGSYPDRAEEVAETARIIARQIEDAPLQWADARATAALHEAESLGPDDVVVQGRRAPVLLSTMLVSRILELVVHADDLLRSVRRVRGADAAPDPVDPVALHLVAEELLDIVVARGGWDLEVADARLWLRLAAGRVPYDVDALARALHPRFASDAVPDLGRMLPLL